MAVATRAPVSPGTVTLLRSLGRAELTLLLRNRTAMFTALLMPLAMVASTRAMMSNMGVAEDSAFSTSELLVTGGIGFVLIMVIYTTLVATYVTRREELVLKRLRTGEVADWQILASAALPVVVIAVAQCVLLIGAGSAVMDVAAPSNALLLLAGVVLGVVMLAAMAAATAIITKTMESAQVTSLPLLMIALLTSGMVIPLDAMPDNVADGLRLLPMTPVMELVRGGWLGGLEAVDALRALGVALAWTALSVFAVRRWFQWEPRH